MTIRIEYASGEKYDVMLPEESYEDAAACMLDSTHTTVRVATDEHQSV